MRKISINTTDFSYLNWTERWPYLKSRGFKHLEVATEWSQNETVLGAIKNREITVSAAHEWFHFFTPNDAAGIEQMQRRLIENIERTRQLRTDKLIWYTGANDTYKGKKAVDELLRRLEPVLVKAQELNITLLLETEFSQGEDPGASVKLLKKLFTDAKTPFLACNFDAANLYVAGEEPFPYAYEELRPWIQYVHVKDVRRFVPGVHSDESVKGWPQIGKVNAVCCAAGEGAVNHCGIFDALKKDGYDGYLSIELHMKREYQDETLTKALAFLDKYW